MPRLRALSASANRKKGEEFDASDKDARILCAKDAFGGPKAELVDRAMRAEPALTAPKQEPRKDDGKRRYLRRDMRAQN